MAEDDVTSTPKDEMTRTISLIVIGSSRQPPPG